MEPFLFLSGLIAVLGRIGFTINFIMKGIAMKRISLMFVVIMLVTSVAFGGEPKPKGRGHDCSAMHMKKGPIFGDVERLKQELGLSDLQVDKIIAINKQYEMKMLDIREKLAPNVIQLKKLLLQDVVDINAVRAKLKEIADLRVELHLLRIQHVIDIEKQLNKEQLNKLRQYKRAEMENMKKMRPGGDCGPMGPGGPDDGPMM